MGARWFPDLSEHTGSTLAAFVTNPLAVQFVHRWLGAVVVLAAIVVAIRLARRTGLRRYAVLLPLLTAAQFALGIWTILRFYLHPVTLGVAHQLGAVILLSATVLACFAASRVPADADVAAGIRD
jgi:cytochrome c oxidase assembly protein subunit 15